MVMPMTNEYEFFTYAGGQLNTAAIEVFAYPMGDLTVRSIADADLASGVQVLWVHTAAPDWTVVCNWAALTSAYRHRILVMPFLPSARGDKDTPCPAHTNARLAALSGITGLVTIDPHSPVWLDTLRAVNPTVAAHVIDMAQVVAAAVDGDYLGVIGPDAGSLRRASAVATRLWLPVCVADKKRDPATGHLLGYKAPPEAQDNPGRYLVVDDICDGGGTFALLAQSLGDGFDLDLWVTHGGFTKGTDVLTDNYKVVHTTDSLRSAVAAVASAPEGVAVKIHPLHNYVLDILDTINTTR
ncbi:phosphoribosylpyrophosphate synthetase [Mycobacteroides abscessus subsp. abscessus]|uniref:ribose-phosphate pyrophosphokinase n=1 Tax=Mycobacteroides abscessus TaxID=36809 RepID=UPI00092621C9|nr:ribose-phosphate pyrophosphokinase [Mycobacteroides abscessus]SIH36066.1 phosphoribosylpyrophosphate synthetase [Mycobacteroides abscessus subsp. abscessus]